jgi:hypothetical protein
MSTPKRDGKRVLRPLQAGVGTVKSAARVSLEESGSLESFKVANRWSGRAIRKGFVPVALEFLDRYASLTPWGLTPGEAMFVIHVIRYKWNGDAPFPGYRSIALQMGVSIKSARRYAQSLERKKLLRRTFRLGDTNQFDFSPLMQALECAMQQRERKPVPSSCLAGPGGI